MMFGDSMVTVKNTFIDFENSTPHAEPRSKSVPASARLCQATCVKDCDHKLRDHFDSDVSTYCSESVYCGASTYSESSGTRTPVSFDDALSPLSFGSLPTTPQMSWSRQTPLQLLAQVAPPPKPHTELRRLNAKAPAFQPQTKDQDPYKERYRKHMSEVMHLAKAAMQDSEHVLNVEVSEDATGWSVIIRPKGSCESQAQTELLTTLAKEALLDAATQSNCIYVMGYCGGKPFNMRPQGFEATLGAMRSASSACWHVYKKGFCRHQDNCNKQHPACQVPVHVLVEGVQLECVPRFADAFKSVVADLALTVTAELEESPYVELVAAFKDKDAPGWTIELTAKDDLTAPKEEYLLTLAKNALFSASHNKDIIYIMGCQAKPFTSKSHGFVTIIGDMQDETKVCWDLYSKGMCSRDCQCRWEHPECLMPINVVVKERSMKKALPISLLAAMQPHFGDNVQSPVARR